MIPLVNAKVARQPQRAEESWWRGPATWIVAALALMAAIDAAYLTYTSFSHSVVAGCGAVSIANCDLVLSSRWSRWLSLPVALGGAICYTSIFVLSLVTGRLKGEAGRWAGTLLVSLALLAAASGLWFTSIQIFALGSICLHCIATHMSGLVIASLVLWTAFKNRSSSINRSQSFSALAAVPGAGPRRATAAPRPSLGPSFGIAVGGMAGLLALLIAGQILFPPQTVQAEKPQLDESIDMTASDDSPQDDAENLSPTAKKHVVNHATDSDDPLASESETSDATADQANDDANASDENPTRAAEGADGSEIASTDEAKTDNTPPKDTAPALSRQVKFLNGRVKINSYNEAVLGSPEAPYVVIEMIDYTCPHCREMHEHIKKARSRYGDQLAIVIMPVPLEMECNKLIQVVLSEHRGACRMARLALSVAKIDPEAFTDFHNYLLADKEHPPSGVQALNAAWRLVDQKQLSALWNSDPIKKRINQYINLFSALSDRYNTAEKPFGLPVQIVGDTVFNGKFESDDAMFEAWEKAIDIKPE